MDLDSWKFACFFQLYAGVLVWDITFPRKLCQNQSDNLIYQLLQRTSKEGSMTEGGGGGGTHMFSDRKGREEGKLPGRAGLHHIW